MSRVKRHYLNFPIDFISGWWKSYGDYKQSLRKAYLFHVVYMTGRLNDKGLGLAEIYNNLYDSMYLGTLEQYESLIYSHESQDMAKFIRKRENHDAIMSQVWFSVEDSLFDKAYDFESFEARAEFFAYLAIRSLLGGKLFRLIDKQKLAARMMGKTELRIDMNNLPEPLNTIFKVRYQFDKFRNCLYQHYGVAFFAYQATKGFYISLAKDKDTGLGNILLLKEQVDKLITQANRKKTNSLKSAIAKAKNNNTLNKGDTLNKQGGEEKISRNTLNKGDKSPQKNSIATAREQHNNSTRTAQEQHKNDTRTAP